MPNPRKDPSGHVVGGTRKNKRPTGRDCNGTGTTFSMDSCCFAYICPIPANHKPPLPHRKLSGFCPVTYSLHLPPALSTNPPPYLFRLYSEISIRIVMGQGLFSPWIHDVLHTFVPYPRTTNRHYPTGNSVVFAQ